jgi:hypothetical protein
LWVGHPVLQLRGAGAQSDDVLRVEREPLSGLGLDHPRERHQRAAGGVEDQLLDVRRRAFDAVAVAADNRDIGERGQEPSLSAWS